MKKRKLNPKYAKSVKKFPAQRQAYDEGFRIGRECYRPYDYFNAKMQSHHDRGYWAGVNLKKNKAYE